MRAMGWPGYASESAVGASVSRGLAGALLIALAAFCAPSAARATCVPSLQTISKAVSGPIVSNGGAITVTTTGSIAGNPDGVDAVSCPISTLTDSGAINGGAAGGAGVSNGQTITSLVNPGSITGGTNGPTRTGGAGVSSTGAIGTLRNGGTIGGGVGGISMVICCLHPPLVAPPGPGGPGMLNAGTTTTLINSGTITGGRGGSSSLTGGFGGAGVSNTGTVATMTNNGTIGGGAGGSGAKIGGGGSGVSNSGMITTLTNTGKILGRFGTFHAGAGLSSSGKIEVLTNSGIIQGGYRSPSIAGDAILSAGANASIGPITNSGQIIGNVTIDNQASVTIKGGSGTTFGSLSGGKITIGNGSLMFAEGNTDLAESIAVNGGASKVTNGGVLRLAASETITGNFTQGSSGTFDSLIAGDSAGKYGSLTMTKLATLDGRLSLDLTGGFTLAAGDSFDLFNFAGLSFTSPAHDFRTLTFDGVGCIDNGAGVWGCSNLGALHFTETITASAFDLNVVKGSDPVPETATWVMLAASFLGLGGIGMRRRRRSVAIDL
jgi:hypothetical protein